jgi:hypothetical protein
VAEPAASVRERRGGDSVVFEVVTGVPEESGGFASHGHTIRLTVLPAATALATSPGGRGPGCHEYHRIRGIGSGR